MTGPNFYTIDFDREVVLQGKSSTFVTIGRNDDVLTATENLYVMVFPNTRFFKSFASMYNGTATAVGQNLNLQLTGTVPSSTGTDFFGFNNIATDMYVKGFDYFPYATTGPSGGAVGGTVGPGRVVSASKLISTGSIPYGYDVLFYNEGDETGSCPPVAPGTTSTHIGYWIEDVGQHWKINGKRVDEYEVIAYKDDGSGQPAHQAVYSIPNLFDGSTEYFPGGILTGSGYVGRINGGWCKILYDADAPNKSTTIRIDYDGELDLHMKLNFIVWKLDPTVSPPPFASSFESPLFDYESWGNPPNTSGSYVTEPYGPKSGGDPLTPIAGQISNYVDYQELHLFGYTPTPIRASRETWQNSYQTEVKIYDDRSSYSLLKTNPKLSGNVKITLDSKGDLWLNSIDANDELADSAYKKYPISSRSTYAYDLYKFFKDGQTPSSIIFDLYQVDDQYQNTKRILSEQYDNFYNYGVEQLKNRYYDENFSFFSPLWLRKTVPDYFIIFRLDHPLAVESYQSAVTNPEKFSSFFKDARIVKTFDMREKSKLGAYLRKIVNDPRFKERPIDVSFDSDVATVWNGVSYQNGTMTGKGEFLYDYWRQDRPIIELEEYITGGFERNGVISTNLVNLEFLFDDEEATSYTINRYFGLYVTENQLANFEIEPEVLGKIPNQTPLPKAGVDGQPYSTKPFVQSNPNGIVVPVSYYHNQTLTNNNTNVPVYQGEVVGKFPLPSMVDDPMRIFYIKDRDDAFKRITSLTEVDYGNPGTYDYKRVTELKLFDNQEDMSKYAGVNQITSQFPAKLLDEGTSQLRLHLSKVDSGYVFDDGETIELTFNQYNNDTRNHTYYFKVKSVTASDISFTIFKDNFTTKLFAGATMPAVGSQFGINLSGTTEEFTVGDICYITNAGYFEVFVIPSPSQLILTNVGMQGNAAPGTAISSDELISVAGPTYEISYTYNPLTFDVNIDPLLTLTLSDYPLNSYYTTSDSYRIGVKETELFITDLDITNPSNPLKAKLTPAFQQFRWKMIANSNGLRPGEAWDYPVEDPDGYEYVTTFSNEGTSSQVAQALGAAINSFESRPCDAVVYDNVVYLRSKTFGKEANQIQLTRRMVDGESNVFNLSFYETGNVITTQTASVLYGVAGSSQYDVPVKFVNKSFGTIGDAYTYLKIWKTPATTSGTFVQIRTEIDPTSIATAAMTGVVNSIITSAKGVLTDELLPFSIDITNVPDFTFAEYIVKTTVGPSEISQLFIGGESRNRNRARILYTDSQRYYADQRIKKSGDTVAGSDQITNLSVSLDDLYIGAKITGSGIPDKTEITYINLFTGALTISNPATLTQTNVELTFSELSILNTSKIRDQWYQTQKGTYSPMEGWLVQGKYVYSLPYLEEPIYDKKNHITGYTNLGEYSVINIEKELQEFYLTYDKRIVAYNIYRPILGLFTVFPIKTFDFDFYFSDYSYTPILEAFRYYFNEEINSGESIVLTPYENYKIALVDSSGNNVNGTYTINIEGYNKVTKQYQFIESLTAGLTTSTFPNEIILNTYYPFYVYDVYEQPQKWDDPYDKFYGGSGKRNYMSRAISSTDSFGIVEENPPIFYRITLTASTTLSRKFKITKNDYGEDKDLKSFSGFFALEDINTPEDADAVRSLLNDEKYVDAFLRQALRSEYDRLRENFNKDYALRSKVVPYINKWVQEGSDARDNYYRLDNSRAFGISNLSPDSSVSFAEPSLLTNEFPYLDTVPKDYPDESLEGSRSYMFAKLSDYAKTITVNTISTDYTWLDLLTSNDEDDWFTKYFAVGYPTELNTSGDAVTKSRDERYTFFNYNQGIKKSQTLFRGAKIQVLDINDQLVPPVEITSSQKYNGYKFAAIARVLPISPFTREKPVDIEICRNDKFKSIVMIITVHMQDYRIQSGLADYLFFYAVNDQLKNYNQQQIQVDATSSVSVGSHSVLNITDFLPYGGTVTNMLSYTDVAVLRPRQGFFGGGYLELGDTKLGGYVSESGVKWNGQTPTSATNTLRPVFDTVTKKLTLNYLSTDPATYEFSVLNEIIPTFDKYSIKTNTYVSSVTQLGVLPQSLTKDGSLFKLIDVARTSTGRIKHIDRIDTRIVIDQFLPTQTIFGSTREKLVATITPGALNAGEYGIAKDTSLPSVYELETFNIKGGTSAYVHIKNLLTYASLLKYVNSDSGTIEYYKIENNQKTPVTDYKLRFVSSDQIIKTGVLAYVDDTDKPIEYLGSPLIGYNIVNTNQNEVVYRHRGSYEPKATDILSFWVREDESFTKHFNKDYLLFNTRFNTESPLSGLLRNYGINKVADAEVLKIARGSAYKSVYPLVGEVSIDKKDMFILDSTWDKNYYRKYYETTAWNDLNGIEDMTEYKSFMGSKAMNVPKSHTLDTFNSSELTYEVSQPSRVVGVPQLSTREPSLTDVQGSRKPVLVIEVDAKTRLLRKLYEEITSGATGTFNEFSWITTLGIPELSSPTITATDIERLTKEYLEKNILPLYQIDEVKLYALSKEGIPIIDITSTNAQKISTGYRVDKDCQVKNLDQFIVSITKELDTKKPYGFSVDVTIKRI